MPKNIAGIPTVSMVSGFCLDNRNRRNVEQLVIYKEDREEKKFETRLPLCLSASLPGEQMCPIRSEIHGIFFCKGSPDKCQVFTNPERR